MYVMHWSILGVLENLGVLAPLPRVVSFSLYFALVYAVARVVYDRFESRFLALKDRADAWGRAAAAPRRSAGP